MNGISISKDLNGTLCCCSKKLKYFLKEFALKFSSLKLVLFNSLMTNCLMPILTILSSLSFIDFGYN